MSYPKDMNDFAQEIHAWAKSKGWYDNPYDKQLESLLDLPLKDMDLAKMAELEVLKKDYVLRGRNIGELLALVHSEVSEALESYRDGDMTTTYEEDGKPVGFPSELADTIIRVLDLAEYLNINIQQEVVNKMTYNLTRPYRHGGKVA